MDMRGTGLRPQRPAGWEHGSQILAGGGAQPEGPQGAAKGPAATSRSMQAPIPGEVADAMACGGGFLGPILAGRPGMAAERARPGDDSNMSGGLGTAGAFPPAGKGSGGGLVSKPGAIGSAPHASHVGGGRGGF